MKPYYDEGGITIYHGDCREVLPTLDLLDAVVTDPPYGISFMNKKWDRDTPDVEYWKIVKAALLPGAHLLAMGGTRTYHRLACAIEDAGLEVRDCVMWLYAMGFPKSLDVGKAIDRAAGVKREMVGKLMAPAKSIYSQGQIEMSQDVDITAPATDAAKQWNGWGTALKPATELICLARKPLSEKTVAANVLKHGTGALNIDATRIGTDGGTTRSHQAEYPKNTDGTEDRSDHWARTGHKINQLDKGRWPANVLLEDCDEVKGMFPNIGGGPKRDAMTPTTHDGPAKFGYSPERHQFSVGDSGSAARFFFCAKTSPSERGKSDHPTMKPVALMRYLCRLVTPPGGVVLDPFMGAGSTLVAAQAESFHAVGIELEEKYCEIAANRLSQQVFDFDGGDDVSTR